MARKTKRSGKLTKSAKPALAKDSGIGIIAVSLVALVAILSVVAMVLVTKGAGTGTGSNLYGNAGKAEIVDATNRAGLATGCSNPRLVGGEWRCTDGVSGDIQAY